MNRPTSDVERRIVELIQARSKLGFEKYGVTLDREDLTPADWIQHAIEELLDGASYLEAVKLEFEYLTGLKELVLDLLKESTNEEHFDRFRELTGEEPPEPNNLPL